MQPCCRYVAGANDKECPERRAWNQTKPQTNYQSFTFVAYVTVLC